MTPAVDPDEDFDPTRTTAVSEVSPDSVLAAGTILNGTYRVVRLIAEGGMGAVYEGEHVRLHRRVAVKVLLRQFSHHPEALTRFRQEAEVVGQLRHPHIVQVFDVDETPGGQPYFVMEFLDGETLGERLEREPHLSVIDALGICAQLARALASAHGHGIVHRDVKPDNIFLVSVPGEQDFVKILDFGISKVADDQVSVTGEQVAVGTPEYMAPEQAQGRADIDHRADQFALGTVVYQMLSGQVPFHADNATGTLYQVVHEPAQRLSEAAPWVPVELDHVLERALSKRPGQRFPTISQFAWALDAAARSSGIHAKDRDRSSWPPPPPQPPQPAPSRAPGREETPTKTDGRSPASEGGTKMTAEQCFERAKESSAAGRHDEAVYYAEQLFDLTVYGKDPHLYRLMRYAIPVLDRIFEERVGPGDTALVVGAAGRDPHSLSLSRRAAEMLGNLDGGATVDELIRATGYPRRGALRLLAGLMRRGVVAER